MDRYEPGELFVYVNGGRWELGQVKRENNTGNGYFCWYSTGDTCANTPTGCMHKLANAGCSHAERERTCRNIDDKFPYFKCSECGCNSVVGYLGNGAGLPNYCPHCGAKVVSE